MDLHLHQAPLRPITEVGRGGEPEDEILLVFIQQPVQVVVRGELQRQLRLVHPGCRRSDHRPRSIEVSLRQVDHRLLNDARDVRWVERESPVVRRMRLAIPPQPEQQVAPGTCRRRRSGVELDCFLEMAEGILPASQQLLRERGPHEQSGMTG
jgi:hypothetical protein